MSNKKQTSATISTLASDILKNPTGVEIPWTGFLTIEQDWNEILIALKTSTSSSSSLSVQGSIEHILSGSAKYYNNGKERPSYGTMKLRRSANA